MPVILTCAEPDITDSVSNLDLIVVLIDEVKLFKLPLLVSNAFNLFSWFKSVVAIELDKLPTLLVKDELKLVIVDVKPLVVVAILELNVSYPVVPVNTTCALPEITLSPSNFDLIVVLIDEVKLFKLPDDVSSAVTLVSLLDVYDWNVVSSNLPVPIATPFKDIDPLIWTDPVNLWVSMKSSPNADEPLAKLVVM